MRTTTPRIGDERIIEIYLLFPVEINHDLRWLEKAKIKQIYREVVCFDHPPTSRESWVDESWVDD